MTISHSIVAPQVPWGIKKNLLMRSIPDPSSLVKGLAQSSVFDLLVFVAIHYHASCSINNKNDLSLLLALTVDG